MTGKKPIKSVITCDLEGRMETYNEGARRLFGYEPEEIIGKERVTVFSPGLIVLGHVGQWLKKSVEEGEYTATTVFRRKDGTLFPAKIRIRPTKKRSGEQIGYCGITHELEDMTVEEAMPKIGLMTRLIAAMVITRAPFLTAILVPIIIGAAWSAATIGPINWWAFALAMMGGAALQIASNTFNDYFDWKSGTDQANTEYFQAFSGGSRAIEMELISERGMFLVGVGASLFALLTGALLTLIQGPGILLFGLAGLFSAYFYTAPPLRLVARRGLGEVFIGLNFGPLVTAGTVYALSGQVSLIDFAIGAPIGLLTSAILWANQFPDAASDALTGKNHLVVTLGKERARYGYAALVFGAFLITLIGVATQYFPVSAAAFLLGLPLAVYSTTILFRHFQSRELVRACTATIQLQLLAGLAMALGLIFF